MEHFDLLILSFFTVKLLLTIIFYCFKIVFIRNEYFAFSFTLKDLSMLSIRLCSV